MRYFCAILLGTFCLNYSFSQTKTFQTSGDVILIASPVISIGTTLIQKDYKGTWQFAKGFLLNQGVTFGLKKLIKKERPNQENFQSFPSAHSSTVFQSAAFLQRRYGWEYGIPAYALAGFTAFSRIDAKKHDFVDVLVGAIIGVGSSYLFTTPYQQAHMDLGFTKDRGNYLLSFTFRF